MRFDELQNLMAEQFSCDAEELTRDTLLEDLQMDHEDVVELAWALGEEVGAELSEEDIADKETVGDLYAFLRDVEAEQL